MEVKKMTRTQAVEMLKEHGFGTFDKTGLDIYGNWISGSSFDEQVGVKESYTMAEVRNWLGY